METRFENTTVDTEQVLCNLYRFGQKKLIRRQVILMSVFLGISIVAMVLLESSVFLILVAYYVYLLVKAINHARTNGRKSYLRRLEYYDNSMPPMTHRFYDDYFVSNDVDSTNITPYCKIKRVVIRDGMVWIVRKNGEIYYMCADGFTKGTLEAFRLFIQMKAPQAFSENKTTQN